MQWVTHEILCIVRNIDHWPKGEVILLEVYHE